MFDFLKRFFPKKGEPLEDLDDDMYGTETDSLPEDDDEPAQSTKYRLEGLLMDFLRKFRKNPDQQETVPDNVFVFSASDEEKGQEGKLGAGAGGLLGKINSLEGAPKYAFLGVSTLLLVSVLYGGVHLFRGSGKESPKRPPASQVQQKKETEKELPANPMLAAMSASAMENPFVEATSATTDIPVSAKRMDIPAIPASSMQVPRSSSMPIIPSTPRPSIPSVQQPMPVIPSGGTPASAPASAHSGNGSGIQGVITSSNPNDNIAIMGDGSVVSVGETFRDGRIAYIGGDGITFEDGSKMQIKQP